MNKLKNKVAVVYGNGAVGAAIAKAFAEEGAKVFLTGRTLAKLKTIAGEVLSKGGAIEVEELDGLDEQAVEQHMNETIKKAGRIDISFNAIGITSKEVDHLPLIDLSVEGFSYPISTYTRTHFITARAAARHMIKQDGGVIIMHVANPGRVSAPFAGGRAPAWAAMEALCRSLSVECAPYGVRAVCLLTTAIPETPVIKKAFEELFEANARASGVTLEQFNAGIEGGTHRKQLTRLKELTDAAVFAASDEGSAITGTVLNLTAGMIV